MLTSVATNFSHQDGRAVHTN